MSKNTNIKVCMLTYNQSQYVAESIESVVSQECSYDYQLIIAEDCSPDNTRQICEQYAERYQDKIKLLPTPENLGIYKNFFRTLKECSTADYVAFCEGDDKWIDKGKLQHQVDFLEQHPEYVASAQNTIYRDTRTQTDRMFWETGDQVLDANLLFNKWPFHAVSLVMRGSLLRNIPYDELPYFVAADRFLLMWIGCHGKAYYEGDLAMGVYHRHDGGASTNDIRHEVRQQNLNLLEFIRPYLKERKVYNTALKGFISGYYVAYCSEDAPSMVRNRISDFFRYLKRFSPSQWRVDVYNLLLILFGKPFYKLKSKRQSPTT